jgi:hypothetical protein
MENQVAVNNTQEEQFIEWFKSKYGRLPLEHSEKDNDIRHAFMLGVLVGNSK